MGISHTIYADNAATTALYPEVLECMLPYFSSDYGNPSAVYSTGRMARRALEDAREATAEILGVKPNEIIFTSGGTESNNIAIKGSIKTVNNSKILTSKTEHSSVLKAVKNLEKHGSGVTYISVDSNGEVSLGDIRKAIQRETSLISIHQVNNETGCIQPIDKIADICRTYGVTLHTDGTAAAGKTPLPVEFADLISFSAHKFHGPKGIGVLYKKESTSLSPLFCGGEQEMGYRPGTENVALAVGLAKALELSNLKMASSAITITALETMLTEGLSPLGINVLGSNKRIPGILNILIPGTDSEALVLILDMMGICVSGGSACSSGNHTPSHVLTAMGLSAEAAKSAIRFSFSADNTASDIEKIITAMPEAIKKSKIR